MPRFPTFSCLCGAPFLAAAAAVPAQDGPGAPGLPPLPHPDIPQPPEFHPGTPWWIYAGVGVAAAVLIMAMLWLLLAKGKSRPTAAMPPLDEASRSLQALLAVCGNMPPEDTAHAVSTILRTYLERRYGIPAPMRTSEEIFQGGARAKELVPEAFLNRFAPLARIYDRLEFGHVLKTTGDARALVQESIDALKEEASPPPAVIPQAQH